MEKETQQKLPRSIVESKDELTPAQFAIRRDMLPYDSLTPAQRAIAGMANPYLEFQSTITKLGQTLTRLHEVIPDDHKRRQIIQSAVGYHGVNSSAMKAMTNFSNRFNNLPDQYKIVQTESVEGSGDEPTIELVSDEEGSASRIPFEELPSALGIMDILKQTTEREVMSFLSHLMRFPMLALEHKIGQTIRDAIKDMSRKMHVKKDLYRCRIHNAQAMAWTEAEMWEAPIGVSSQGRFNMTGHGVLYTSEDQTAALLEMKQRPGTRLDVMKLAFDAEIEVIDLTEDDNELFRYCLFPASSDAKLRREYLIPNFIAQCCQIAGIHAIKYKSVHKQDASNFVFFDYLNSWFKYQSNDILEVPPNETN